MTVVNFSSEIYHIAIVCLKKEQNAEVGCRIKLWRTITHEPSYTQAHEG